ncbi:hypothetical protein GT045_12860 [Streptomyces sp. SID486]|uniref:hypothetical protein n=1 Tax=Streptomyces sp. SID486 TaxID=2690264 RepID=UPI00136C372B|nr:hypothetical protein [Streptomyces sp. SID486]MYX95678.1 hypothetical protein [Streptomyces sp. SID486]
MALEVPLSTGANNSVVPDVVLFHDMAAHIVLCEAKSGANVEVEQARRYGAVTPERVVQATAVNLPHAVKPSMEVLYLGLEEHAERLALSLDSAGVGYPLVAVSDKLIRLVTPERASEHLKAGLPRRGVELLAPPITYIPYDHESDDSEFIAPVRSHLVKAAALGESSVTVRRLAEDCCRYYAFYGRAARGQLLRKVSAAARQIARDYPDTFQCSLSPGRDDTIVRILRTPEAFDARGRTQAYQALSRRSRSRQRLQPDPNQLDLLQELGDGDDSEDDEAEERP